MNYMNTILGAIIVPPPPPYIAGRGPAGGDPGTVYLACLFFVIIFITVILYCINNDRK